MAGSEHGTGGDDQPESGSGDPGSPVVPVLGRPLVRAEFWAILLAVAALAFGSLAAARAAGAVGGDPRLIGAAALAQASLAAHYARRPMGYARGTLPVPGHWYRIVAVVAVGMAAGAVATVVLG
ncbi:hypothetical protein [Haloglomus litoreum]|uniref:hypothetical protein n=1 Tax=Haloglomus litoreum TaxID=3034026 RepID=UPI0023E8B330|nr:hypothetical protein [Haloglomus sp. DT116]